MPKNNIYEEFWTLVNEVLDKKEGSYSAVSTYTETENQLRAIKFYRDFFQRLLEEE